MGVASAFTFGRMFGAAEAWALSTGAPVEHVTPVTWKKALGLGLNATFTPIPDANHGLRRIKQQPQIFNAIREAVTAP